MKALFKIRSRRISKSVIALVVAILCLHAGFGQITDCISGTVMYGVFIPITTGSGNDSTEIRSINFSTGAIGPYVAGRRYMLKKTTSSTVYGSAAMAVENGTGRFFLMSQMPGGATGGAKDIYMIDPSAPSINGYVVTGTTPASLNRYHFVKMGIPPGATGFAYAVGVSADFSGEPTGTFNPLVRFSTCTTPACATASITVLGYLDTSAISYKLQLYNGDIVFDNAGNLYYLSAGYSSTLTKYTDTRLFKINAADIPSSAGTGIIPMTFIADYNMIDSTGVSGLAVDQGGNMYFSLKRFTNGNSAAAGQPFNTELYKSASAGVANLMAGFTPLPANKTLADLGSCYYPTVILDNNKLELAGKYASASASLSWTVSGNANISYFEVQRSDDGKEFTTIAHINASASGQYSYSDGEAWFGKPRYYRIRENMVSGGVRYYSNVVKISFATKITLVSKPKPNPFVSAVDFMVQLKSSGVVNIRLMDNSGKTLYSHRFDGQAGENKLTVNDLGNLARGVYIAEISVDDEVIREKIIKNN